MQFQVPQNITMEDRIIGPLTAIQFGIVVLGGGASFFVFQSRGIPSPLNAVIGLFLALLTVIMAIGKFNDQPLYRFTRFIVAFIFSPKVRVWHKGGGEEKVLVLPNPHNQNKQATRVVKNFSKHDIARLATVLDSRGTVGVAPKVTTTTESIPPAQTPPR